METYWDEKLNDCVCCASDMIEVKDVALLECYRLLITFSNGEQRIYDVAQILDDEMFASLKSPSLFSKAHAECGTVVWNDEIDLCPEMVYRDSIPVN